MLHSLRVAWDELLKLFIATIPTMAYVNSRLEQVKKMLQTTLTAKEPVVEAMFDVARGAELAAFHQETSEQLLVNAQFAEEELEDIRNDIDGLDEM